MVWTRKPPSPTWLAFLENHVKNLVSADFFVVSTVSFKVLFVFIVLAHARRRIVHFNVTEHPNAQWTTRQLSDTFPWRRPHASSSEIAIADTGPSSRPEWNAWASRKFSPALVALPEPLRGASHRQHPA